MIYCFSLVMSTGLYRIGSWVQVAFENGVTLPVTDQHYRAARYQPFLDELPFERERSAIVPDVSDGGQLAAPD